MQNAGLYIHIPFCEKKCGYCDFYSITTLQRRGDFISALCREMELIAPHYSHLRFDTIFLGGGTPSILDMEQLSEIWDRLHSSFAIESEGEFTIESNPGTLTADKLAALRRLGFNRLSMGVQSFQEEDLKFLGRIHNVQDVYNNFDAARKAGFENINLDLMTAFPGLTRKRFENTLEQAASLRPEHISCYTLIFEPRTPFYARMKRGELQPLTEESESQFYETANDFLSVRGYSAYEISNFSSTKDWRCKHNLKYWEHQPYLGLGPSAHSFVSNRRWWNIRPLRSYIQTLSENKVPVSDQEELDDSTLEFEYIYLHLRLREGINTSDYQKKFRHNFLRKYKNVIQSLKEDGLLQQIGKQVTLTSRGWLLADEIAGAF